MYPDFQEFVELRKRGNIVPVCKPVMADLLTPVSAFMKIASGRPYGFLLESVEGGEKIARYSFLGCDPERVVRSRGDQVRIIQGASEKQKTANVLEVLKELRAGWRPVSLESLPPFTGGGVGYFSYDVARLFERIPDNCPDPLELDESLFMFFSTLLAFDHVKHQILIISNVFDDGKEAPRPLYERAVENIAGMERALRQPLSAEQFGLQTAPSPFPADFPVKSNFTRESYYDAVRRAQDYIREGEIFQVVLSQRFKTDLAADPLDVYRALRVVNPSPYMFFLRMGDLALAGASPEMLLKAQGQQLFYRPIAGTRPRGASDGEDQQLAEELVQDEKERAEHLMLVDLGRNDLGRVSQFGSVSVRELMFIERYSHVMHLVSSLTGQLRPDLDCLDAFAACFPAGTVTGAPKIRAMEIIDELENVRRGVYAGAVAYLDYSGNLDSCISIRTLVMKQGTAYAQAGGGIVADSTPEGEYQECVNKARALVKAVELAHHKVAMA
ncbi:MAG: anthranilate synthase component I [Acidobacteria bacterium]|nr:anthranilate synthase component I [Acidobacteriota bacterium]